MFSNRLRLAGVSLIALAVVLLAVKLLMFIAWYAAGTIGLIGLVLLAIGMLTDRNRPRW
jgi:membrane-bound ClpP family serine protease